jgi:hypothetical protein
LTVDFIRFAAFALCVVHYHGNTNVWLPSWLLFPEGLLATYYKGGIFYVHTARREGKIKQLLE